MGVSYHLVFLGIISIFVRFGSTERGRMIPSKSPGPGQYNTITRVKIVDCI